MLKMTIKNIIKSIIQMTKEKQIQPIPSPINTTELLKGKVALITGGSGEIGSAIARAFLQNSCRVIIAGSSPERLEEAVVSIGGGSNLQAITINILDCNSLNEKVKCASEFFGHIDILVNAAGVNSHTDFLNITEDEYDRVVNTNAKGTFFMTQAVANYMIKNKIKGHILNVTSSSALRPAVTPYRMSKWAMRGFTLGAADRLLKHGIIVNAIAPGPVATSMLHKKAGDSLYKEGQPSGRYAVPTEIANMAVMLVSELCDLVVGDTLYITGGSGLISLHD